MNQSCLSRRCLLLGLAASLATPATAATRRYVIGPGGARITFAFLLNGTRQTGTAPLARADVRIDPDNLAAATADVAVDIRRAKTGLIFATQALKSSEVLDAAAHPLVRFRSTSLRLGRAGRLSEGARLRGDLTLRGITRPLTLNVAITRPAGTRPDELDHLSVHLTGHLSRRAFGAAGFDDLVADRVDLDIQAEISAKG